MSSEITTLLSSTFGRLISEKHPVSHARKGLELGHETQQDIWREFAEGGWLDAGGRDFQDEYGSGITLMGELAGKALLTLPYASSVFLVSVLCERKPDLLEQNVVLDLAEHPASLRCDDQGGNECWFDMYGEAAQYLHLTCVQDNWHLRRYQAQDFEQAEALDPCVRLGNLKKNAQPQAEAVLSFETVMPVLQSYLVFLLADILGAASASLDAAIEYAKERQQFGRQIGQFQAVKHALVNAWMGLDNGRYALDALQIQGEQIDASLSAMANRLIIAAAKKASKLSIQVHGGIGFSWEHDAQLYLKRVYRLSIETGRIARLFQ